MYVVLTSELGGGGRLSTETSFMEQILLLSFLPSHFLHFERMDMFFLLMLDEDRKTFPIDLKLLSMLLLPLINQVVEFLLNPRKLFVHLVPLLLFKK